jgi:Reverse transcriptase (RNA-dependent DNA polymerase)
LLPSRVAYVALSVGDRRIRDVLEATLRVGYRAKPVEVVHVPKLDRTTRPAADMPIEDQLVYAALVKSLRAHIPDGFVEFTGGGERDYQEFERFPLSVEGASYVLEADAAGFYQYVDHERLAYELVGLTGRADLVEPLIRMLEAWLGRPRGLPQGPPISYMLADIYIAPTDRALHRAGYSFSRYSDDFRVAGHTWGEVKRAQGNIEESFYALGLVIAAKKLRTPKIETYRGFLERVDDPRLQRQTVREAIDELETEDYVPSLGIRVAVSSEAATRAAAVFDDQLLADKVDVLSTRLIRRALPILGSAGDMRALRQLSSLLARYPHLSASAATYVRLLLGTDHETPTLEGIADWITAGRYRHPWQEGWILYAAAHATIRLHRLAEPALRILQSSRKPWFARAQAALVLATHGRLPSQRDFVSVYERAPEATRPDLIAAVLIAEPRWATQFLSGVADRPITAAVTTLSPETFRDWI